MNCDLPPGPCDVEFGEGSEILSYERGGVTQYHIEGAAATEGGVQPCWKVTVNGDSSLEGSTIMFMGDAQLRAPPGLIMADSQ